MSTRILIGRKREREREGRWKTTIRGGATKPCDVSWHVHRDRMPKRVRRKGASTVRRVIDDESKISGLGGPGLNGYYRKSLLQIIGQVRVRELRIVKPGR